MNLRTMLSAGMLITAGMLASRLLGFLREAMIAAQYGSGADAGMVIGLLLIPDYITSMLIAGALSAVLLPAFAKRNEAQRLALFWQVMLLSVVVFTLLALLLYSQSAAIIGALHGDGGAVPHAALFWALFSMPLAGAGGVVTAWLQYHNRFAIPAFANALFNLVIVLTLWVAPSGFTVLGLGIFTAGLIRLALFATGFAATPGALVVRGQPWQISRRLLAHYASAVGNSFFSLLPQYIPYLIITLLSGQMALFNYAFKLVLMPAMVLNTMVGMVLLPRFVHLRSRGEDLPDYGRSLRLGTLLASCIALVLSLASMQVVALCFGYGQMTEADIQAVASLFAIGVWALPGMVAGYVWQQVFYACERPAIPFKVGIAQALASIPLVWAGQAMFQEAGVMAAFVLLQILPVPIFSLLAARQYILPYAMQWKGLLRMLCMSLLAFFPLAAIFTFIAPAPLVGMVAALVMVVIILSAGLAVDNEYRQWLKERNRRA